MVGALAVDEHQRRRADDAFELRGGHARGAEDDAVDLLGHGLDEGDLLGGVLVGVGEEDRVVGLACA